jgi:hypothetical protein
VSFGDLATDYCRQLTSCFAKAHTVADVFDRYDVKNSIKSAERERSGNERIGEASFSNCFTRSDLQDFLIVPSSWNMDTGIGPTGCERMLSIVTSSLLLSKTKYACYQRSAGFFAVCYPQRQKKSGCERMLSIVTSSLLLSKTRARLKAISGLTGYDFPRFAFQVCLGIHVFKSFQF